MELVQILEKAAITHRESCSIKINGSIMKINHRNHVTATEKKHIRGLVEYIITNNATCPVGLKHKSEKWTGKKLNDCFYIIRKFKDSNIERTHTFIVS